MENSVMRLLVDHPTNQDRTAAASEQQSLPWQYEWAIHLTNAPETALAAPMVLAVFPSSLLFQEYNGNLSKIRSFLAGTRSRATLKECERLLTAAKKSAGAMQGLAEVEGNPMKIREASQRLERDISPLAKEVQRALGDENREELFYQAPNADDSGDMESLIQGSEDLLRESQALCLETEQVGGNVIQQMAGQREQLEGTRSNIDATREYAEQAALILRSMSAKALRHRLFLQFLIGVLLVANVFALVKMFRPSNAT
eukprot:scaffold350_cov133-Cylindrotheca_fusiformis.AAC.7